jgi:peptidoglycan hydrolase-like protein with peptidoglycan-binding domain
MCEHHEEAEPTTVARRTLIRGAGGALLAGGLVTGTATAANAATSQNGWCWGHAYREISGSTTLSNHASGIAIDINAPRHPLGASGTFSSTQVSRTRPRSCSPTAATRSPPTAPSARSPRSKVVSFQQSRNLFPDGIVGRVTWSRLTV